MPSARHFIGAAVGGLPGALSLWAIPFLWSAADWGMSFAGAVIFYGALVLLAGGAVIGALVAELLRSERNVARVPHALGAAVACAGAALTAGLLLQHVSWGVTMLSTL